MARLGPFFLPIAEGRHAQRRPEEQKSLEETSPVAGGLKGGIERGPNVKLTG